MQLRRRGLLLDSLPTLQAKVLGVQAEKVADSLTGDGFILSHDQRFHVANAARDVLRLLNNRFNNLQVSLHWHVAHSSSSSASVS